MCVKKFRKPRSARPVEDVIAPDPECPREIQLASLEFANLKTLARLGIACPEPIDRKDCLVLMKMIGDKDGPAPTLKEAVTAYPEVWEETFYQCLHLLRDLFSKARLVHGNMSEKKLLWRSCPSFICRMWGGRVYLTGLARAVAVDNPVADKLLLRDIHTILSFFNRTNSFPNLRELEAKTHQFVTASEEELEELDFFNYLDSQLCIVCLNNRGSLSYFVIHNQRMKCPFIVLLFLFGIMVPTSTYI